MLNKNLSILLEIAVLGYIQETPESRQSRRCINTRRVFALCQLTDGYQQTADSTIRKTSRVMFVRGKSKTHCTHRSTCVIACKVSSYAWERRSLWYSLAWQPSQHTGCFLKAASGRCCVVSRWLGRKQPSSQASQGLPSAAQRARPSNPEHVNRPLVAALATSVSSNVAVWIPHQRSFSDIWNYDYYGNIVIYVNNDDRKWKYNDGLVR